MHADAEGGGAAHSLYKGNLENPAEASLFRSKMTPDGSLKVQRTLSAAKSGAGKQKGATAAVTAASDLDPSTADTATVTAVAQAAAVVTDIAATAPNIAVTISLPVVENNQTRVLDAGERRKNDQVRRKRRSKGGRRSLRSARSATSKDVGSNSNPQP